MAEGTESANEVGSGIRGVKPGDEGDTRSEVAGVSGMDEESRPRPMPSHGAARFLSAVSRATIRTVSAFAVFHSASRQAPR